MEEEDRMENYTQEIGILRFIRKLVLIGLAIASVSLSILFAVLLDINPIFGIIIALLVAVAFAYIQYGITILILKIFMSALPDLYAQFEDFAFGLYESFGAFNGESRVRKIKTVLIYVGTNMVVSFINLIPIIGQFLYLILNVCTLWALCLCWIEGQVSNE